MSLKGGVAPAGLALSNRSDDELPSRKGLGLGSRSVVAGMSEADRDAMSAGGWQGWNGHSGAPSPQVTSPAASTRQVGSPAASPVMQGEGSNADDEAMGDCAGFEDGHSQASVPAPLPLPHAKGAACTGAGGSHSAHVHGQAMEVEVEDADGSAAAGHPRPHALGTQFTSFTRKFSVGFCTFASQTYKIRTANVQNPTLNLLALLVQKYKC